MVFQIIEQYVYLKSKSKKNVLVHCGKIVERIIGAVYSRKFQGGVICISKVIDVSPGNLYSSLCFFQPRVLMMYSAYKS